MSRERLPAFPVAAKSMLRISELAPLLGVTSGRVYQLIAAGEIPATRVGRALRVPVPALNAWLQRCTTEARRNAKHAAEARLGVRPVPVTDVEKTLVQATRLLAANWPCGWRGTASELLDALEEYRGAANEAQPWPRDGRLVSIAIRRLIAPLTRVGVNVQLGHRGHAGKRLISVTAASSAASPRVIARAATGAGRASPRTRADAGDVVYTGRLRLRLDPDNPDHAALIERLERKETEEEGRAAEAGRDQR
jgi:excisionase family DNA binding protein